ncbi:MAG: winged helix-turn-helix domain-containing protein [Bryobacteraceae bacterium]
MQELRPADVVNGNRLIRFGGFELRLDTGELKKHGVRVRLQGKPFRILCALVERPGSVVTREELRSRVWSSDTFVDFESGLNTAINRLRTTLGDSSESPIYVETLARIGYRFIAPITVVESTASERPNRVAEINHAGTPVRLATVSSGQTQSWMFAVALAVLALITAGTVLWAVKFQRSEPVFQRLTFRKGSVLNARFMPDGKSVLYSAQWNGAPSRLFLAHLRDSQTRDLGFEKTFLASVSPTNDIALFAMPNNSSMVLEAVSLRPLSARGDAPRAVSANAICADWGRGGRLAIATQERSVYAVEYPPGHGLYRSTGWINNVRVSPQGDRVAFAEHPVYGDDAGQVVVADLQGRARILSANWGSLEGVAWHPSGREVWFTAARSGVERTLMAVDMSGRSRQVAHVPGGLLLRDVAASGETLIARATQRMIMILGNISDKSMRDISWLDWSRAVAITPDAKNVLFDESGAGGGKQYSVYLYRTGPGSPERLGDGTAKAISDDGRWALTSEALDTTKLFLLSIDSHQVSPIPSLGLPYRWAKFFPAGKEILFAVDGMGGKARIYRQQLPKGNPILVKTDLELYDPVFDKTGEVAIGFGGDAKITLIDFAKGAARSIETEKHLMPVVVVDKHEILTRRRDDRAVLFEFLNLETGKIRPYTRIEPAESTGMEALSSVLVARDLQTFVCSRQQTLSDLFVVSGWK